MTNAERNEKILLDLITSTEQMLYVADKDH